MSLSEIKEVLRLAETHNRGGRRAILAEVAEAAGVSISTVSKVANGVPDVADATRARVSALLADHRYVAMKRRRPAGAAIAILVRAMTPHNDAVIDGLVAVARPLGTQIHLLVADAPSPDLSWVDDLRGAGIKGLVAIDSRLTAAVRDYLERAGIALVSVSPMDRLHRGTYSVGATHWTGGFAAAEHLIALGHRRIAILAGDKASIDNRARVSGYRAALEQAELDVDSELVVEGDFTYESGLDAGLRVLSAGEPPTAILAASDVQAMGAIEAARQMGVRVPQELSIVGYDDIAVASMAAPPLTTVRQPLAEMGAAAFDLLTKLVSGASTGMRHIELATEVVLRSSTAPRECDETV
jgi:LacI family transcriptional regulator